MVTDISVWRNALPHGATTRSRRVLPVNANESAVRKSRIRCAYAARILESGVVERILYGRGPSTMLHDDQGDAKNPKFGSVSTGPRRTQAMDERSDLPPTLGEFAPHFV